MIVNERSKRHYFCIQMYVCIKTSNCRTNQFLSSYTNGCHLSFDLGLSILVPTVLTRQHYLSFFFFFEIPRIKKTNQINQTKVQQNVLFGLVRRE